MGMGSTTILRGRCIVALAFGAFFLVGAGDAANAPKGGPLLPPQVSGWQAVTDFAMRYPGNVLNITNNNIGFSVAGVFSVRYVGSYGKGILFKIVKAHVPAGRSKELICTADLSYLALTPGRIEIIHEPILSFEAFSGVNVPDWNERNTNANDCGGFTYGAPLNK